MLTVVTPASSDSLVDLESVKQELGIATADTSKDGLLEKLIVQESAVLARWCGRTTFGRQTLRQTIDVPRCGMETVILDNDLNVSITTVTVNGDAYTTDDWELDGSILRRLSSDIPTDWAGGVRSVIVYDAGFDLPDDAPEVLKRACTEMVIYSYRSLGRDISVRSETAEGVGSITFNDMRKGDLPLSNDRINALEAYRAFLFA